MCQASPIPLRTTACLACFFASCSVTSKLVCIVASTGELCMAAHYPSLTLLTIPSNPSQFPKSLLCLSNSLFELYGLESPRLAVFACVDFQIQRIEPILLAHYGDKISLI